MILEELINITKKAGAILVNTDSPKIYKKPGHANFYTETDKTIQRFLIQNIQSLYPQASFVGEEEGMDCFNKVMNEGLCFIIDPIDGTSNFINSFRPSVISIALLKDGKPYIGIVYNPYDNLLFYATRGQGAFLNNNQIVSSNKPLSDSLVLFGTSPYYKELHKRTFDIAQRMLPLCVDLRRSGTAAWDLCCVAMGICGLFFEAKIQLWDYAAGALIAEEAGCSVTDFNGHPLSCNSSSSIICRARGIKEIPDFFM